jgi:hypothetical protein
MVNFLCIRTSLTKITISFIGMSISLLSGCMTQPPARVTSSGVELDDAPNLSRFARFDIASQASGTGGHQKANGILSFSKSSAMFEVSTASHLDAGRLHVQAETCRDDPSPDCKRRYVVTGSLSVLNTSMNCYIPIRNDAAAGYAGQAIFGLCQDKSGRSFSITIFSN